MVVHGTTVLAGGLRPQSVYSTLNIRTVCNLDYLVYDGVETGTYLFEHRHFLQTSVLAGDYVLSLWIQP